MISYQLKIFHAVVGHGGFNRASKYLRLSQPAISANVKKLEEDFSRELDSIETKINTVLKNLGIAPEYTTEVTEMPLGRVGGKGGSSEDRDELFEEAVRTVCQYDRASASLLQRRLKVGYARAARILDELEEAGIVGTGEGSKPRDVLVKNPDDYFAQSATPSQN